MGNRRFARLTNAFSKKVENHMHALAVCFMHYNFVRIHHTTRVTPAMAAGAMAAGVSQTLWSLTDIVRMVDEWEAAARLNDIMSTAAGGQSTDMAWKIDWFGNGQPEGETLGQL